MSDSDSATAILVEPPASPAKPDSPTARSLAGSEGSLRARHGEDKPGRRKLSESRGVNLPDIKIMHPSQSGGTEKDATKVLFRANSNGLHEAGVAESPLTLMQTRQSATSPGASLSRQLVELRVFLPDHRPLRFSLHGGRRATVAQLLPLIYSELGLEPALGAEAFALWMVSPLMELQLKPHHQPFQLRLAWAELLGKFTAAGASAIGGDEPLLFFRRSVLLSRARQATLCAADTGGKTAELLLLDARESVLSGKYATDRPTAFRLAALDLGLTWGPWKPAHTPAFLREALDDFLPEAHLRAAQSTTLFGKPLPGLKGAEEELLAAYRALADESAAGLRDRYLGAAMALPFYGAAFFGGQVERPVERRPGRRLVRRADLPVHVAVSREFLSVVDREAKVVLLVLSLLDCTWRLADAPKDRPDQLPSLFLHFAGPKGGSRLLQIFSRQAVMVSALLNCLISAACREETLRDALSPAQASSGVEEESIFPDVSSVADEEELNARLERLCVAEFGEDGKCVAAQGSLAHLMDQ